MKDKPITRMMKYYDWDETIEYLQDKYNFSIHDTDQEEHSFHDWFLDAANHDLRSTYITIYEEQYFDYRDNGPDIVGRILGYFIDEFGEATYISYG